MRIVCQADDSHEMSRLFSLKKKMTSAAVVIGALRVKGLNTEISQDSEQGITSLTRNTDGSFTMANSNSFSNPWKFF